MTLNENEKYIGHDENPKENTIFNTFERSFLKAYETLWNREERYHINKIRLQIIEKMDKWQQDERKI